MNGAVVSQFPGQTVPLATGGHTEDDAIQDSPRVRTPASRGLGWVHLRYDRLNPLPEIIGDLPDSRQTIALSHHPPPHWFPLS